MGKTTKKLWKRIKQINSLVIGIRPWRDTDYNEYDRVYTISWYISHLIIFLLAMRVVADIFPSAPWWVIRLPDSVIEEWMPIIVIGCISWTGILHQRAKSNQFPEPSDRWRRGEWFPWLWSALFALMFTFDILGFTSEPNLHVVTIALGEIAPIGIGVRFVTQKLKQRNLEEC